MKPQSHQNSKISLFTVLLLVGTFCCAYLKYQQHVHVVFLLFKTTDHFTDPVNHDMQGTQTTCKTLKELV